MVNCYNILLRQCSKAGKQRQVDCMEKKRKGRLLFNAGKELEAVYGSVGGRQDKGVGLTCDSCCCEKKNVRRGAACHERSDGLGVSAGQDRR